MQLRAGFGNRTALYGTKGTFANDVVERVEKVDDETKDLLAEQAKKLAEIYYLVGRVCDFLELVIETMQDAEQENRSNRPLCGCCDHKKAE
ncbi:hypothetical protein IFO70_22940 [Phormidium tenue FACHB-886]|nr:hypothetical protein [Phormidium tenue FACHB-886]